MGKLLVLPNAKVTLQVLPLQVMSLPPHLLLLLQRQLQLLFHRSPPRHPAQVLELVLKQHLPCRGVFLI